MDFNDMKTIENDNVTLSDKIKEADLKLPNLNSKLFEDAKLPEKISVDLDLSKLDLSVLAQLKFPKIEEFTSSEFNLDSEFKLDSKLVEKIDQLKHESEVNVPINLDSKVASQLELPKIQTADDFGITPEKIEVMRKLDFPEIDPVATLQEVEENGPVRINTNRAVDLYTYNELKDKKGKLGAFNTAMQDDENPYFEEKGRSR